MASLSDVVGRFKNEYAEKGLKFLAVSAFNVVFGQGLLVLANAGFGWSFVPSNVFAVGISAGASTSPKGLTSIGTVLATSLLSRPHSTADRGRLSVGKPHPKPSTNCYSHTSEDVLRRPLEPGLNGTRTFVDADTRVVAAVWIAPDKRRYVDLCGQEPDRRLRAGPASRRAGCTPPDRDC